MNEEWKLFCSGKALPEAIETKFVLKIGSYRQSVYALEIIR